MKTEDVGVKTTGLGKKSKNLKGIYLNQLELLPRSRV